MHFEILVEDQSGEKALKVIVSKIIGTGNSFRIHWYKGIGHIPKNMKSKTDVSKRLLLNNLPQILRGYGRTYPSNSLKSEYPAVVIVICDLDKKCLKEFRQSLFDILNSCNPKPETRFCFAIEEGEAWFLGDLKAVKTAYPNAKDDVLDKYENDSICGTWEQLADAVYKGGADTLHASGWQTIGMQKSQWAEKISPHMNIHENKSPSFKYFRDKLLELAEKT